MLTDNEGYNSAHGHAYDFYGIDPEVGALVIVRPDQREYIDLGNSKIRYID